jgi:nucleoside-diphosphate-sugar epimerase
MKILVVGGAGYVGSVLCERLINRGFEVRVLDNLMFGAEGLAKILDRIEFIKGDIRDMPKSVFDDVEALICLAGYSNDPMADFDSKGNFELNHKAVVECAKQAKKNGVKKFVHASTCSVYHVGETQAAGDFKETDLIKPTSAYGESKMLAEKDLVKLQDKNFDVVMLRKGTVFGWSPRMRYDLVVNTFVKDGLTKGEITIDNGGEIWRPMVHVQDAADAYIKVLNTDCRGIFNISHKNYRVSEIALRVYQVFLKQGIPLKLKCEYSNKAVRDYHVDTIKMKRELGFDTKIDIQQGVEEILQKCNRDELLHPKHNNMDWFKLIRKIQKDIGASKV